MSALPVAEQRKALAIYFGAGAIGAVLAYFVGYRLIGIISHAGNEDL